MSTKTVSVSGSSVVSHELDRAIGEKNSGGAKGDSIVNFRHGSSVTVVSPQRFDLPPLKIAGSGIPAPRSDIPAGDMYRRKLLRMKAGSKLVISATTADGKLIAFADGLILDSVAESYVERYQIHDVPNKGKLFSFGSKPEIWALSMKAPNSGNPDTDAYQDFLHKYEKYFRVSMQEEQGSTIFISYEDMLLQVSMLTLGKGHDSSNPLIGSLNLSIFIHQAHITSRGESANLSVFETDEVSNVVFSEEGQHARASASIISISPPIHPNSLSASGLDDQTVDALAAHLFSLSPQDVARRQKANSELRKALAEIQPGS